MRILLVTLMTIALAACGQESASDLAPTPVVSEAGGGQPEAVEPVRSDGEGATLVTVYKTPTCGCCTLWADHMEENGFEVARVDVADLGAVKRQYGIPDSLASCHTAVVDGYVVEGHVPAEDVRRLIQERPGAGGLAVPGMPIGSPGMEVPGVAADRYDVLLISEGEASVFARH